MKRWIWLYPLIFSLILFGCGHRGKGVAYHGPIKVMCLENNPRVTVPGFERDLENLLFARGIRPEIIAQYSECLHPLMLRYVARRSMGAVSLITLDLYENKEKVAYVEWKSRASAGLPNIPTDPYYPAEFWQLAEALAGLLGDIPIEEK